MAEVIMAVSISGTRGEDKWPPPGYPLYCSDEEAAHLIRAGIAVASSGPKTVSREKMTGSMAQLTISPPVTETPEEQKAREALEHPASAPEVLVEAEAPAEEEPPKPPQPNPLEEIAPRRGPGRPPGSSTKPKP